MRAGVDPAQVVGKKIPPAPVRSESDEDGLHIERNVQVLMRDGVRIYVDIYRPAGKAWERQCADPAGLEPLREA